MKVKTIEQLLVLNEYFHGGYTFDIDKSEEAGYHVYLFNDGTYICDLGNHAEINYTNGETHNFWFN